MFTVKIDKDEYKVEFEYAHNLYGKSEIKRTSCYILKENKYQCLSSGRATVHPNETANKNIGRKVSLKRALENAGFGKFTRKLFWEAYYNARGGKW